MAAAAATAAAPAAAVLAAPPEALVAGQLVAAGQAGTSGCADGGSRLCSRRRGVPDEEGWRGVTELDATRGVTPEELTARGVTELTELAARGVADGVALGVMLREGGWVNSMSAAASRALRRRSALWSTTSSAVS